ncbi:hypothetical protein [Hominiventricola aquisgranensis]|uniref:Uncharacterized protein n=1 Tax=Hominiventricola aquisgranensis TaxID=3133164 RepID=A0ABV1I070_9FIRM
MALKEDYKDAVFAGLRKYKMLDNGDGTVSPVDMTEYENGGDKFGAKDVNAITKTVNATGKIIADDNDGFKPDQKYVIGDIVIYDNKTWRFKVDHEPGEWDESQVERTNILGEIAEAKKQCNELTEKMEDAAKKLVVLWTNPEWNSTTNLTPFVAQEIQIDNISDFDMIGICHSVYNNTHNYFNFFLNIFNKENNLTETFSEVKSTEYYVRLYYRKFIITQSGIKFDIGYSNSHTQVAANNSYAIPVKIIGIKF